MPPITRGIKKPPGFYKFKNEGIRKIEINRSQRIRYADLKIQKKYFPAKVLETTTTDGKEFAKVHYIGFSKKFDSVVPTSNLISISTAKSNDFLDRLKFKIKESLKRNDPPTVVITMECDHVTFQRLLFNRSATKKKHRHGFTICHPSKAELELLFGDCSNWAYYVINQGGDFNHIRLPTVTYWMCKDRTIKEFVPIGEEFIQRITKIESSSMKFRFVRDEGTRRQLSSQPWLKMSKIA